MKCPQRLACARPDLGHPSSKSGVANMLPPVALDCGFINARYIEAPAPSHSCAWERGLPSQGKSRL